MLAEFEANNIPSIGFDSLSNVMKQCSVYPLAISVGDEEAIQPLVMKTGDPISPKTNLCDDKRLYQANVEVFRRNQYPLGYPIVVIFPQDNSRPPVGQKFAEMIRTIQIQQLLLEANLVPIIDPFELAKVDEDLLSLKSNTSRNNEQTTVNTNLFDTRRPSTPTSETPELPKDSNTYTLSPNVPTQSANNLRSIIEVILPIDPETPDSSSEGEEALAEEDTALDETDNPAAPDLPEVGEGE